MWGVAHTWCIMEGNSTELDYVNQAFIELLSEDGIAIFARY